MEMLRRRGTAVVLCALLVVGSALLGARASLMDLRRQAEAAFAGGGAEVAAILSNTANLGRLAELGYTGDSTSQALLAEMLDRRGALADANTPAAQYEAVQELWPSLDLLCTWLETQDMDTLHADSLRAYEVELDSSYTKLRRSYADYELAATEFNQALGGFPAGLLGWLTGVRALG